MIKSVSTPTYSLIDNEMVHTGYFVKHPDYPLKYTLKGAWDEMRRKPRFALDESKIVSRLQNA